MKKIEQNESEKTIEETLQAYVDELYAKGYKGEDIIKALDKLGKSLNDEDMKVAGSDIQAKFDTSDEYHYKVIRASEVGELNYPKYIMSNGYLSIFPLVWKGYDLQDLLSKTYYLFDDLNKREQEECASHVETIALKYPIIKSDFFGLVKFPLNSGFSLKRKPKDSKNSK